MSPESQLRAASEAVDKAAGNLEDAKQRRDELIRRAHADGVPMRTIAEWAGLSHQRVDQVLKG